MPKYAKKPKGTDAWQYVAGADWSTVEPWLLDLIAQGRIVTDPPAAVSLGAGTTWAIHPTDWILLHPDGALDVLTDAQFQDTYDTPGPPTITGDV